VVPSVLDAGLHISVYVGAPAGVTQKEGHHRSFFFFCAFSAPPSFCGACLYFLSRERSISPFPSSTVKSNLNLCTHDIVALHCWAWCKKKSQIAPKYEPTTQPSGGFEVTNRATDQAIASVNRGGRNSSKGICFTRK
ncbi:unnamed protein product, partial [Sphacelaria rigidula]